MGDNETSTMFDEGLLEAMKSNLTFEESIESPEQGFVLSMYSLMLVIGAVGNVAVFVSLVRSRHRKSRVNLLMTHLAIADLIVTFCVIPLEIGWRSTNAWIAGNFACKFFLVLRAFGLYLSSNILVCVSVDRYFALLYPLRLPVARKRSKIMLTGAWVIALFCSLPQTALLTLLIPFEYCAKSIVFRVMQPPQFPDFNQCVSFGAFTNPNYELVYNMFCLCVMYFLPLIFISGCYARIFYEISNNSKEITDKCIQSPQGSIHLRRSDRRPLARARRRTLRMTVSIVTVFALCWLPYATMTLWYMFDRESAANVSPRVQDLFFVMAVSNSCMNPLVYGSYTSAYKSILKSLKRLFCIKSASELPVESGPITMKSKLATNEVALVETANHLCTSVRHEVRVQETSLIVPSVNSDPSPCYENVRDCRPVRTAKSCELFCVHSQPLKCK